MTSVKLFVVLSFMYLQQIAAVYDIENPDISIAPPEVYDSQYKTTKSKQAFMLVKEVPYCMQHTQKSSEH